VTSIQILARFERRKLGLAHDLEIAMSKEGVDQEILEAATSELGETIRQHVNTAFLVGSKLDAEQIQRNLVKASSRKFL
jgi:transcriptional regulator NrdR family protein